jgi:CRISPR-associated endonuclease Cas2
MLYLLFYDITTDSIRNRVAKLLIDEGFERLQFSVYTAIEDPKNNSVLWNKLKHLLASESTAKLYVIAITKNNFRNIKIIGNFDHDIDYLLGDKRSLTF